MAPPWLAAQQGAISDHVARITGRGWYHLKAGDFHQKLSAVGNPVAAMPSLHAAVSLFVALYGASRLRSRWRWLLLLYPLTMAFTLVYYAEHYVIDILAGYAVAGLVLWGCARWEHSRAQDRLGRVLTEAIPHQVRAFPRERLSGESLPREARMTATSRQTSPTAVAAREGRRCVDPQVEGGKG